LARLSYTDGSTLDNSACENEGSNFMREDTTVTRPAWFSWPNLPILKILVRQNSVGRAQEVLTAFPARLSDGPWGDGGQSPCCLSDPAGIEAIGGLAHSWSRRIK
jgi:hypothetical protein